MYVGLNLPIFYLEFLYLFLQVRVAYSLLWGAIFLKMYLFLFIYLFLAALGLHCCTWAFSSCSECRLLFVAVCGLLIVVPSRCRARAPACGLQ